MFLKLFFVYQAQLVSAVVVLKGYAEFVIYKCGRIFDVSYFRPYAKKKSNGGEWKVCIKWIQFRSWFRSSGAKVSSFIIQKFSCCFGLSFNVSVDVVQIFLVVL